MGNRTKEDELYREMCRVVGKVVLEMRDLGQEPKHIVIAGVLRTALANKRIQRRELEKQAMEAVGVLEILCHSSNIQSKRNDTCPNPSISIKRLKHSSPVRH